MAKKKQVEQEDLLEIEMSLIDKYKKPFVAGCVILVLAVAVVSLWKWQSAKSEQEAQEQLFKSEAYFRSGQFELALNGDTISGDSTKSKGLLALTSGSTDAANLARLYAGLSYANLGQWENAVKYLEDYSVQGDQTISVTALRALGNCYANLDNIDKAVTTLKKAAKQAKGNSLASACLLDAAQLLESQGKKEDAKALYESIKKDFPQLTQQVDKYLLRLAQ